MYNKYLHGAVGYLCTEANAFLFLHRAWMLKHWWAGWDNFVLLPFPSYSTWPTLPASRPLCFRVLPPKPNDSSLHPPSLSSQPIRSLYYSATYHIEDGAEANGTCCSVLDKYGLYTLPQWQELSHRLPEQKHQLLIVWAFGFLSLWISFSLGV